MMGKKDYQLFADSISLIESEEQRENLISFLVPVFKSDNYRFSEDRFRDWIQRRINKDTMKGTKYNPKYMPLGVC